jgi:hypothetical protein
MAKKAEMSINAIVAAALALIVLVILLFIFKNQIGNIAGGFTSAGNNAKGGISGTTCKTLLGDRICENQCDDKIKAVYTCTIIPKPTCSDEDTKKYDNMKPRPSPYPCAKWSDCTDCVEITKKQT